MRTGCRIPVVRVLWEHVDWVRFPAARQKNRTMDSIVLYRVL